MTDLDYDTLHQEAPAKKTRDSVDHLQKVFTQELKYLQSRAEKFEDAGLEEQASFYRNEAAKVREVILSLTRG